MKRRVIYLEMLASPVWWKWMIEGFMKRTSEQLSRYKEIWPGMPVIALEYVST